MIFIDGSTVLLVQQKQQQLLPPGDSALEPSWQRILHHFNVYFISTQDKLFAVMQPNELLAAVPAVWPGAHGSKAVIMWLVTGLSDAVECIWPVTVGHMSAIRKTKALQLDLPHTPSLQASRTGHTWL